MTIGSSLTHYRVTAKLGEGGMGEVYRATDTKLGRDVAIKVLPASISRDATSLARFEREAKALASLNHPHIAAIHGFDADQGTHFLVLELVEGPTLSERLRRGRLPVDEALRVARQIAEAVEAAHAKGIIHRDLKPGNIKLTPEGRVKVLDFGLAKMASGSAGVLAGGSPRDGRAGEDAGAPSQDAPTILAETTQPGAVMGTPAYRSPEQARGLEVDKRTDVWAFGCCLFECLSGRTPFQGKTASELIAEVLKSEPDWTELPAETPPAVVTLARRCLEKEPRRRLRDMGDIAITLDETSQASRQTARSAAATDANRQPLPISVAPRSKSAWLRPAAAGLVLGLIIAVVALWKRGGTGANGNTAIRSVAVLPFENLTQDASLDALCNGLSDDISTGLKKRGVLDKVPLWSAVKAYRGSTETPKKIAGQLGVESVMNATGKREGKELRINADLIDGSSDKLLWSESFSTKDEDVGRLRSQVVLALLNRLHPGLTEPQKARLAQGKRVNAEAYAAYRRGQEQFALLTKTGFAAAEQEFERARKLDPSFIEPLVALVRCQWFPGFWGFASVTPGERFARTESLLAEATRLAPDHPAVLTARGLVALARDWDWKASRDLFHKALALDPENVDCLEALARYAAGVEGRYEEATDYLNRAVAINPENPFIPAIQPWIQVRHGRYAEALAVQERNFRQQPTAWNSLDGMSDCLLALNRPKEAREAAEKAILLSNRHPFALHRLAMVEARSGAREAALRLLREMEEHSSTIVVGGFFMAAIHASLGDMNSAFRLLDQGVTNKESWDFAQWMRSVGFLSLFAEQPRYWDLIDQMKLPALPIEHPFHVKEQQMRFHRPPNPRATTSSVTATNAPQSIAVLPFVNMSADKDNEYFSDGISEEILNALARTPGLKVVARTSAFSFKGRNETVQHIGDALKVGVILEGSVRRAGNQLRITAQLINVADGFHLWSDTFDRKAEGVFAIQTEVARRVQEVLKGKLLAGDSPNTSLPGTDNLDAYDLYLRGRELWNKRTGADLQRAISYFQQATEKDPKFALAYAGIGSCYVILHFYKEVALQETLPKARAAARRALDFDPRLAEAQTVLAYCLSMEGDFAGAGKGFRQALALNPNYATAHQWYAETLVESGKLGEGLLEIRLAQNLDPLSAVIQMNVGRILFINRKYEEALVQVDKTLAFSPNFPPVHWVRGCLKIAQMKFPEAIADLERARALGDTSPEVSAHLGHCYAATGRINAAQQLLEELKTSAAKGFVVAAFVAFLYEGLGDKEQAFAWLERAATNPHERVQTFQYWPIWDGVTSDPRYAALLNKYGLDK